MVNFLGGDYPNPAKDYVVIGNVSLNEKLIRQPLLIPLEKLLRKKQ